MSSDQVEVIQHNPFVKDAKTKNPLHYSTYQIVNNTNVIYKTKEEALPLMKKLANVLNEVYKDIKKYIIIKSPPEATVNDKFWIESIKVEISPEINEKAKNNNLRPHSHTILEIHHRTKLRVDFEAINAEVKEKMGLPNMYQRYTLYRATSDNLKNYIRKTLN